MSHPSEELLFASAPTRARVGADGRWNGQVTRKRLPVHQDHRDRDHEDQEHQDHHELNPTLRRLLAGIWLGQASTEARVATSFQVIGDGLRSLNADAGIVRLAERAVDDEHRHAALCEELAGRYAGRCVGPYRELPDQRPQHPGVEDSVRHALYVVGQCALNETFASAYLAAANEGATTPLAKAALRELLSDEIDHARIGWAFLHDTPLKLRSVLSDWLLPLTVCNLREWRALRLPEDDSLQAHGVPPRELAQDAITGALHGVLIPGFRHVGLDTRALERWAVRGAPV